MKLRRRVGWQWTWIWGLPLVFALSAVGVWDEQFHCAAMHKRWLKAKQRHGQSPPVPPSHHRLPTTSRVAVGAQGLPELPSSVTVEALRCSWPQGSDCRRCRYRVKIRGDFGVLWSWLKHVLEDFNSSRVDWLLIDDAGELGLALALVVDLSHAK